MNKKLFLITIFLTALAPLWAQNNYQIVFNDDFNNNNSYWNVTSNKNYFAKINNGFYTISANKKQSLITIGTQQFIDYSKNFTIQTSVKYVSGPKNKGFGLFWGARNIKHSYLFLITNNQYFAIGIQFGKKYIPICKWKKSKFIKPYRFNTLKIEKNGPNIIFFINSHPVFTTVFMPFFGQLHGFALQGGLTIKADYFLITKQPQKILLAKNIKFLSKPIRLSKNINTIYTEIAPVISPDGKTLYFGRINDPRNLGPKHDCDIWYSKLMPNGSWGPAIHAPKPLNNFGPNAVVKITPDENAIILEGQYNKDGSFKSKKGISISYKTPNGWSVPKPIKIRNFYNKNIFDTYSLSNDMSILIMSVQRDDSYGGLDLYVSFRLPDGSYSTPKNLGPVVNTFADEGTPFLAADNKTLYFSSNGHPGYGSHDIFVTRRLDSTWTNWSTPLNLGPQINSPDWDTYLSIPAKGDYAYFSSTYHSVGNEDIYKIKLDTQYRPQPVILLYGKVLNYQNNKPVAATIILNNLKNNKFLGIAHSDPTDGSYKITLPFGKIYSIRAKASNFFPLSDTINLASAKPSYKEIKKDLILFPIQKNQVIKLHNVFFVRAQPKLLPESYPELNRLVQLMKQNPTMEIELLGYTDYRGDPKLLLELSKKRVETVKKYLVSHGINPDRIKTKAFGGKNPVYTGPVESLHKLNRRVEFKIIKL